MRFQIISVKHNFVEDFKQKYGKVLERYNVEYLKADSIEGAFSDLLCLFDEDCDFENNIYAFIRINTFAELMALKQELDKRLILYDADGVEVIEIYDGYRE